jgi:hypothetical protein
MPLLKNVSTPPLVRLYLATCLAAGCAGPGSSAQCVPGLVVACPCPEAVSGTQQCTTEGTFGECQCEPQLDASPAADASPDGQACPPGTTGVDGECVDDVFIGDVGGSLIECPPQLMAAVRAPVNIVCGFICHGNRAPGHDYDGTLGDPVFAPVAGTIIERISDQPARPANPDTDSSCEWKGSQLGWCCGHGFGNYLVIKDRKNRLWWIGHMRRDTVAVNVGDVVVAGQRLGAMGNSGYTCSPGGDGSHVHVSVKVGTTWTDFTSCLTGPAVEAPAIECRDTDGDTYGIGNECDSQDCDDTMPNYQSWDATHAGCLGALQAGATCADRDGDGAYAGANCPTPDEDCDDFDSNSTTGCGPCSCPDGDGDGHVSATCADPDCRFRGDCNDTRTDIHPGATEVCGNSVDDDCTGGDATCPASCSCTDADGDGFHSQACTDVDCPARTDCNDLLGGVHPGATEVCNNGLDDDCTGGDMTCPALCSCGDADGDGYYPQSCSDPDCPMRTDCNDGASNIHPGSAEVCGNGLDEDCLGGDMPCAPACSCVDSDGDGYYPLTCSDLDCPARSDCNDSSPGVHPGATDICANGVDEDCSNGDCGPTCGDGVCAVSEDPQNCSADCSPVFLDQSRLGRTTNGGCASTSSGWHPAGGIVYWTYATTCPLPTVHTPATYGYEYGRWSFRIRKTGRYKVLVKIPPSGAACNFASSSYVTGAQYMLVRPDSFGVVYQVNQRANIGAEATVTASVAINAGEAALYLYDSVTDIANCCECATTRRVMFDYAKFEWVGP